MATFAVVNVRDGTMPPTRPLIPEKNRLSSHLKPIIERCWSEEPTKRPGAGDVETQVVRSLNLAGRTQKPMIQQIFTRLEVYAEQLEDEVEARTIALLIERRKCEDLLQEIFPK